MTALTTEELHAQTHAGLATLVARALAGDEEARIALAPLVEAAQEPTEGDGFRVYLPREEDASL